MKIEALKAGLTDYIDTEIIGKADGWKKFFMATAIALSMPKIDLMINQYQENIKKIGITDENGEIDIPKLHECMKQGIAKSGSFEWNGMIFDEKDIEKLFYYINKRGQ